MNAVKKTITMKKEDAKTWLSALRSGEYAQAAGSLVKTDYFGDTASYCCLGVLQCVTGKVQEDRSLPTLRWLRDHKISIEEAGKDPFGEGGRNREVDIALDPPVGSKKCADVRYSTVSALNDSGEFNFREIADILDKRIKRV